MTRAERRRLDQQRAIAGGRRATDPIVDLETEARPFLSLNLLAAYFAVDRRFLLDCIAEQLLIAHQFKSEWRVKRTNALAFERAQMVRAGKRVS